MEKTMKKLITICAVVMVLAVNGMAQAATIYTTDFYGKFGKVDTATGVYSLIKTISTPYSLSNLVSNPSGFSVTATPTGAPGGMKLYNLSSNGTMGSEICTVGKNINAMSRASDGTMYAQDAYGYLGTINTTTAVWTGIGEAKMTLSLPIGGRMVFHQGTLYASECPDTGVFGSFNLSTGAFVTLKSNYTVFASMVLASDGTTLFGLNGTKLYTLSTAGVVLSTTTISGTGMPSTWSGAATVVPEPATIAILGLGGLLLRRKKTA
jgi:hypothetical protein